MAFTEDDFKQLQANTKGKGQAGKMPKQSANSITRAIVRAVNFQQCCVAYRINNVGVYDAKNGIRRKGNTEKGLPDVWCCIHGRFLAVEIKAKGDRLSEDQKMRRDEIQRAGGTWFTAKSTDEFLAFFTKYLADVRADKI